MKENKFEENNELTHRANQNCALASSGEEEQKPIPVAGPRAVRCVRGRAHTWGGGLTCRCRCPTPKPQYGVEWSGMQSRNLLVQPIAQR
jgi:hypothetical protein